MLKVKKLLLPILLCVCAVFAALGLVACNRQPQTEYPDYRYPEGYVPDEPDIEVPDGKERVVINTKSQGGLGLDGITVTLSKGETQVTSGISANGKVTFAIEPDVYDISFANLPAGYSLVEEQNLKTNADDNDYTVLFTSSVIPSAAVTGSVYSVGNVMHDFFVYDCDSEAILKLSELLNQYNTVVLNFFYVDCGPCRSEFPALNEASQSYGEKVKVVAMSNKDSARQISEYKAGAKLNNLNMARDTAGLHSLFNVAAWPTTVVIDRFGVIAFMHSGSITDVQEWKTMFATYSSDNYVQSASSSSGGNTGDGNEFVHGDVPDVEQPASELINNAISADLSLVYTPETNDEAWYCWPWLYGYDEDETGYIYASNSGHGMTTAILYTDITLDADEVLSLEYNVSVEANNDILYVLIDREVVASYTGNSDGWIKDNIYTADRAITFNLAFCYYKDEADPDYSVLPEDERCTDTAMLRNLKISKVDRTGGAYDVARAAAYVDGDSVVYSTVEYNSDDNFYYVTDGNGNKTSMLFIDFTGATLWTNLNCDKKINDGTAETGQYYNSLYFILYWQYCTGRDGVLSLKLNGNDHTRTLIENMDMQGFSDNGLVPVTKEMHDMAVDFTKIYCRDYELTYDENMWLQMCYYFAHYGVEHENGNPCFRWLNPVQGMYFSNPYYANDVGKITVNISKPQKQRGAKYLFTAPESGVYLFESLNKNPNIDPFIFIYGSDDWEDYVAQENALEYDRFVPDKNEVGGFRYGNNFRLYYYIEKGQTVRISFALDLGDTGVYDVNITNLGESYTALLVCTTGEGADIDMQDGTFPYDAIPVGFDPDENCYRAIGKDGEYGSKIYIDFIHSNFFDNNGHSLYEIVEHGYFDFSETGGSNYTAMMLDYYNKSIEDKTESDELYGMVAADATLVELLDLLISSMLDTTSADNGWLRFACYYHTYSVTNN